MKLNTEGTGTEGIKKWLVELVYDTRSSNSQYNNAQFMQIIYLSLNDMIKLMIRDTVYILKYAMK